MKTTEGTTLTKTLFLSWCHADRPAKDALISLLQPQLSILAGVTISWWEDSDINTGEDWFAQISTGLDGCDYGLLLLSPSFLASSFITEHELPRFVGLLADRRVLPVALKPLPLDGTRNLRGVEAHQIFADPRSSQAFSELRGAGRDRFALELAGAIRRRILAGS